jgi:hypothetical protein
MRGVKEIESATEATGASVGTRGRGEESKFLR